MSIYYYRIFILFILTSTTQGCSPQAISLGIPVLSSTQSQISASPTQVTLADAPVSILTFSPKDQYGNLISSEDINSLIFTLPTPPPGMSNGTLSPTTSNGKGTYSATFTGTSAGTAIQLGVQINGAAFPNTISITVIHPFLATGNMNSARNSHTSTLLPNGKVLIAGGYNSVTPYLNSTELYDPQTGTFTPTINLSHAAYLHTSTLLPNGKVLIAGGYSTSNSIISTADVYDPQANTITPTASLVNEARTAHTSTLLPDGTVLIAGGLNTPTIYNGMSSAELYNPQGNSGLGSFTSTSSFLIIARYGHTDTLLPNGKVLIAGGNNYSISPSFIPSAELFNPQTGSFTMSNGSLNTGRSMHTSILLPNGKVLIAGGIGSSSYLSSAELYDPQTDTFSTTDSMSVASAYRKSTLLPNGKVLILGGIDSSNQAISTAELYDPQTGTFTRTDNLSTARDYLISTLLPNGKVLIAGGNGNSNNAELYTPTGISPSSFVATASLNTPRNQHSSTLIPITFGLGLPFGKILITGGLDNSNNPLRTAELYTFQSGTGMFSLTTGSLNTARANHTSTLLPTAYPTNVPTPITPILITGGSDGGSTYLSSTELYNPQTDTFSTGAPLKAARAFHNSTLLSNGKILITAGINNSGYLSSAELYDPLTGTFSLTTKSLQNARSQHTSTLLPNGKVLIVGGINNYSPLNSAELYDSQTGTFTLTGAPLHVPRNGHSSLLLPNGKVLIVGGSDSISLKYAEVYDPQANTFTPTPPMIIARRKQMSILLPNGTVLIAGGIDNLGNPLTSAELYDPQQNSFTLTNPLNNARSSSTITLLPNGGPLIIGGKNDNTGTVLNSAELYQ